jgi:phosphoserine phosphatase
LPLGILPRRLLHRSNSFGTRRPTFEPGLQLAYPDRLHRRQFSRESPCEQRTRFILGAAGDHAHHPRIAGAIERLAFGQQDDRGNASIARLRLPLLPGGERHAGRAHDFVSPRQPLRVACDQFRRGDRIERREPLAEPRAAEFGMERARFLASGGGNRRQLREPIEQRLKIKPGTADQDRQPVRLMRGVDLGFGEREPTADRAIFRGIDRAVKPMRRARHFGGAGPCAEHGQVAIDLLAVGIDDDAVEFLGERQRQRRFAARRRPGDDRDFMRLGLAHELVCSTGLAFAPSLADNARMGENVVTLIAAEAGDGALGAAEAARQALAKLGALLDATDWLAAARACDIPFDDLAPDQADAGIRAALGGTAIDVLSQASAGRRKQLLVADMEATIIANEMLDELAELAGIQPQIAAITQRAMNGEIEFTGALRERVALLKDLSESALAEAGDRIRINPGAAALVATMRAHGAYTALVSGGFRIYAERVRRLLGFNVAIANELIVAGGKLAGTVREPILGKEAKLAALTLLAVEHGLSFAAALAVGDGANDLPMIEAAGMGVAYHAKPVVATATRLRIDHADLTALLYAQGYREEEIVRASVR